MIQECCDFCKKPMCDYRDKSGNYWEGISFKSKKYKRRIRFIGDGWTKYLSICGRCRAELAKKRDEDA